MKKILKKISYLIPDKLYLSLKYRFKMKRKINWKNPKTYNEKLQWLKLYDRNPLYTKLVDKYEVKKYVSTIIGDEYIIPTIGIYNSFDEIDFDKMPSQFVIKCTHDSGGIVICKDKKTFDKKTAKKKIEKSLKNNFYSSHREWPYKNVKPRIIIEKYLEDKKYKELRDYKFFCFSGDVKIMFVASNRQKKGDTYFDFYDTNFNHLDIINGHPNSPNKIEKPRNFDKMIYLSKVLSKGLKHVRVDFYEVDGKVYFGEMTFFDGSGFDKIEPEIWDYKLGNMLNIDQIYKRTSGKSQ